MVAFDWYPVPAHGIPPLLGPPAGAVRLMRRTVFGRRTVRIGVIGARGQKPAED